MNRVLERLQPFLLILFGFLLLFIVGQVEAAGVFLLIGFVMIVLKIWPEEWGDEESIM